MQEFPPGSNRAREVAIVGGGIGGMAAALAFSLRGARVTVHEAAPVLREAGAGLQVSPNGGAVLQALGLREPFEGAGPAARAVRLVAGRSGRRIARVPLTAPAGLPAPRSIHRADLLGLLSDAARAAGVRVRLGSAAQEVLPAGGTAHGRPILRLSDGLMQQPDLLIGADGIRSRVRGLVGAAPPAAFTGQVAWRALVRAEAEEPALSPEGPAIHLFPGRHVVTYRLREGGLVNIVAVAERAEWAEEGWDHPDDPANLRAAFADASGPLRDLLARVGECRLWGLFRHPVAERFGAGHVALLGDAAHPTLPFLAQGANLALEDAWALAEETDAPIQIPLALDRYTARRRPRVVRALAAADANARHYHLSGPARIAAWTALGLGSTVAPWTLARRYAWLHGHDETAARP